MGWMSNKQYQGKDAINESFNGKKYRSAGRVNSKAQLAEAKRDLKRLGYKSVRSKKSKVKGYVVYVPSRRP